MHKHCAICEKIDPTLPHTENAENIGVAESTIRRHRAAKATASHTNLDDADDFFADIPAEIITNRGRSTRLEDGSWEKITYRPQDLARVNAHELRYDDLLAEIKAFQPLTLFRDYSEAVKPDSDRVLCVADLQIGKAKEVGGGTPQTIAKVKQAFADFATILAQNPTNTVLFVDNGDIVEGFDNTGSQAQTNDSDMTTQLRIARRLIWEGLKLIAPLCKKLVYVSVSSNHCQVRAKNSKDLASVVENDWGLFIADEIRDLLEAADNPALAHVEVVVPAQGEEAVTIKVGTTNIGFVHGHQSGSPDKIGEWWKGQSHGRRSGLHMADILVHGHYHSLRVTQSGDSRWLIGAPTSDPGSGWFARIKGETAKSGMLTFTIADGQWGDLQIL